MTYDDSPASSRASEKAAVDSFLDSKLTRPPSRPEQIDRPRVIARLEGMQTRSVVLVTAPAGFGKTTMVAQWLDAGRSPRHVAWMSADAGDNDPARLWTHVATALERSRGAWASDVADFVARNRDDITTRVLPALLTAMADLDDETVLVVDDFHLVHDPACRDQMSFLAEHLPPRVQLVISARSDPGLRLGRLRASGRVGELRASDLAFDGAEARAMFVRENITLPGESVDELVRRTGGWPAVLYLATLSIPRQADPDEFVRHFSGENRLVGDYLVEEVLAQHTHEVREFIMRVAILDRLCVDLCDVVAQTTSSARILRDLERTNMFLIPLDEQRQWYRFHHLFASAARAQLKLQHDDRVSAGHRRAGAWFREHGHTEAAVEHLLAGGSTEEAAVLIQASWWMFLGAGRAATVAGWLEAIGGPTIAMIPAAGVTAAWMAALSGDTEGLAQHVSDLQPSLEHGPLPDGTHSVESAIAMLHTLFGFAGPSAMAAGARRVVELEADPRSPNHAIGLLGLGHVAYVTGDLSVAAGLLGEATEHPASPALVRVLSSSLHALVDAERSRPDHARAHARLAMEIVEARGLHAMPQASLAFTALGQTLIDSGNLREAADTLEQGLVLRRRNPALAPWATMHQLLASARLATSLGHPGVARQLLDENRELMDRFDVGMDHMRARQAAIEEVLAQPAADGGNRFVPDEPLTDREVDVLRLLQGSSSLHEIATHLHLSHNTVKTHAQSIYRKLGVGTRADAVRVARERALV